MPATTNPATTQPATTQPATTPISKRLRSGTKRVLNFSGRAVLCVCAGAAVVVAAAAAAPLVVIFAPLIYSQRKAYIRESKQRIYEYENRQDIHYHRQLMFRQLRRGD